MRWGSMGRGGGCASLQGGKLRSTRDFKHGAHSEQGALAPWSSCSVEQEQTHTRDIMTEHIRGRRAVDGQASQPQVGRGSLCVTLQEEGCPRPGTSRHKGPRRGGGGEEGAEVAGLVCIPRAAASLWEI